MIDLATPWIWYCASSHRATVRRTPRELIGSEWRFSRAAIRDWLRRPSMKPRRLESAKAWKDDPYLHKKLREINQQREPSVTEDGA